MRSTQTLSVLIFGLCLTGCTADPDAPVNQTYPIRQLDRFFESLSAPSAPREYTTQPGYAPAYPVY